MNSIAEKISDTIKAEELRNSNNPNFEDIQQIIDEMKKLGIDKKAGYTLPLADTIGRVYFSSLNGNQPTKPNR